MYLHNSRETLAFFLTLSTPLSPYHVPTDYFCDDLCRKYRYMDSNLTQRRRGLEEKIPDIKKTLSMVEFLRDRRVRDIHDIIYLIYDIGALFSSSFRHSFFRKGKKRRKGQAQATLMTLTKTNLRTRRTMVGSQCRSRRPLSSRTRSTQKPNSKKRTQCIYGSEYALFTQFTYSSECSE